MFEQQNSTFALNQNNGVYIDKLFAAFISLWEVRNVMIDD